MRTNSVGRRLNAVISGPAFAFLFCLGITAPARAAEAQAGAIAEETVVLPRLQIDESRLGHSGVDWRIAQAHGFELLSDVSARDTRRFAVQFAQYLSFLRRYCPELLLPEDSRFTVVLASASPYSELIPERPSPLGRPARPWAMLLRSDDRATLVVRFAEARSVGRPDHRVAITGAQCAYVSDPQAFGSPLVYSGMLQTEFCFYEAVGGSRPFFGPHQAALKQSVVRITSIMANALDDTVTYHDAQHRWPTYFDVQPEGGDRSTAFLRNRIPRHLPPLGHLFSVESVSPAWAEPIHRLQRDAFVHWCLIADPDHRGRALRDFLLRAGDDPLSDDEFTQLFGMSLAEAHRQVVTYLRGDYTRWRPKEPEPAMPFWEEHPFHDPAVPSRLELHPATSVQVARIRADIFNALGDQESALRALAPRFRREVPEDPDLLISAGALLEQRGDLANAARCYRIAVKNGSDRSAVHLGLARIAWIQVRSAASGRAIAADQTREIVENLERARGRAPGNRSVQLLLCSLAEAVSDLPYESFAADFEAAAPFDRYDYDLLLRIAGISARARRWDDARRWLGRARVATLDRIRLVEVDRLQAALERRALDEFSPTRLIERTKPASSPVAAIPAGDAGTNADDHAPLSKPPIVIPDLKLELLWVPAGTFTMGRPRIPTEGPDAPDSPGPQVTFTGGFWLGKFEVTQAQWAALMQTSVFEQRDRETVFLVEKIAGTPAKDALPIPDKSFRLPVHGEGPQLPMDYVSWHEAKRFCDVLTERERAAGRLPAGFRYDLPTEAQWEYACRSGQETLPTLAEREQQGWMPQVVAQHWTRSCYHGDTFVPELRAVGLKKPNAWGFCDMLGNVAEWCRDWYDESLPAGPLLDPLGPAAGRCKVVRGGGAWGVEAGIRAADPCVRSRDLPDCRYGHGFRVALVRETGRVPALR
ncbi:hypothetical protein DB347_08755 [Opitutaceae bacterium EW11]|nr:hypothetical protein DB347_08755 [Opitutaceae bacterium EW11]